MDRQVIEQKLESLRLCLKRVQQKTPQSVAELSGDADAQDVITLNLTRAVQLCVDIGAHLIAESDHPAPDTMGQTFDTLTRMGLIAPELALRMKKAVGFRNIAIHKLRSDRLADHPSHRHSAHRGFCCLRSRNRGFRGKTRRQAGQTGLINRCRKIRRT